MAASGRPPITVKLVDWADEEGARFGQSLVGSAAVAGTLQPDELRELRDAEGVSAADAMAAHGVELDAMLNAQGRLRERHWLHRVAHRAGAGARGSRPVRWASSPGPTAPNGGRSASPARPRTRARPRWTSVATRYWPRRRLALRCASWRATRGGVGTVGRISRRARDPHRGRRRCHRAGRPASRGRRCPGQGSRRGRASQPLDRRARSTSTWRGRRCSGSRRFRSIPI